MAKKFDTTLSEEILSRFNDRKLFVECGTARGEATMLALDCGFPRVITIEAQPEVFVTASQRFAGDDRVTCLMGDSREVLIEILPGIKEPAVFWLDSHFSTGDPELPGVSKCPILEDLRALREHPIKEHVLLIDDIRYFTHGLPMWGNVMLGDIMTLVLQINPGYKIDFVDGHIPNDILVAEVR